MPPKAGHNMKLYRNTGTVATPTWTLVGDVSDVGIPDLTMGLAELKRRSNNFTKNLATLIQSIAIEFTHIHGLGGTNFTAMRTNFLAGTAEEWLVADGDAATSGTEGLRCPVLIEQFPWDQPQEEVSSHDIRLATAYMEDGGSEVDPTWLVVA